MISYEPQSCPAWDDRGVSDSSKTATITSVDTTKAWLIQSLNSDQEAQLDIGEKMVRGVVANATTLPFDRDNTGQTMNLTWYIAVRLSIQVEGLL